MVAAVTCNMPRHAASKVTSARSTMAAQCSPVPQSPAASSAPLSVRHSRASRRKSNAQKCERPTALQKRGAPPGNQNAVGNSGNWYPRGKFITKQLISQLLADYSHEPRRRGKLVRKLCERLVESALSGDMIAIKEICHRIEGRPGRAARLPLNESEKR